MHKVSEVIVVEGRYDKNTLSQVVDAVIIETSGFGVFNNKEKQQLLRTLAEKRGLIVMTDPDGAGLVIRNFVQGKTKEQSVKRGQARSRGHERGCYHAGTAPVRRHDRR